jgi:hypothetical protein
MALIDNRIGWWKLEDVTAEIGNDWTLNGSATWNSVKFNNGFYTNNNANYLSNAVTTGFDPNNFIFESWIKTDYNVVNGVPSDGNWHALFSWRYDGNNYITIWFAVGFGVFAQYNIGGSASNIFFAKGNWTAGDLVHFMWVYKRAGIAGGANTVRLYIDASLEGSSNIALASQTNVGAYRLSLNQLGFENFTGSQDNVKIYDEADVFQDVIDNRNNEGFPSAVVRKQAIIL